AIWSLRDRPARSLPPSSGPAISMSPRSSEECTSSSDSAATYSPVSTRLSSSSNASCIPASSSSVSSLALWRTFACAFDPAMSYFANRQSKSVDLLSAARRSEEHTSELQSRFDLVCRLLLEKKNISDQQCR